MCVCVFRLLYIENCRAIRREWVRIVFPPVCVSVLDARTSAYSFDSTLSSSLKSINSSYLIIVHNFIIKDDSMEICVLLTYNIVNSFGVPLFHNRGSALPHSNPSPATSPFNSSAVVFVQSMYGLFRLSATTLKVCYLVFFCSGCCCSGGKIELVSFRIIFFISLWSNGKH